MEKNSHSIILSGFCQCGCGRKTSISPSLDNTNGYASGQPKRFCRGHNANRKTHGMTNSKEHLAYRGARSRCNNPKDNNYPRYGGRGIRFNFISFEQFYKELGPKPKRKSLDRIDNDGNYEPGNCRWATAKEQRANQRKQNRICIHLVHSGSFKKGHVGYGKGIPRTPEVRKKMSERLKEIWAIRKANDRTHDGLGTD